MGVFDASLVLKWAGARESKSVHLPPELFFFRSTPLSSPNLAKDEGLLAFAPTACRPALVRLLPLRSIVSPAAGGTCLRVHRQSSTFAGGFSVAARFALGAQSHKVTETHRRVLRTLVLCWWEEKAGAPGMELSNASFRARGCID